MKGHFRWYDYITLNIYWFALTTRAQSLTPVVIPLLVQRFVGEEVKGTYVGQIRLWSLMVALLMQALWGLLSDRCTARWGRRRPFILAGTLGELVIFVLIGLTATLKGMTGYGVLFSLYILSMFSSNAARAATQSLIPDQVPPPSTRARIRGEGITGIAYSLDFFIGGSRWFCKHGEFVGRAALRDGSDGSVYGDCSICA